MQRLEAILFLAREPLSTRNLGRLAGLADGTEARSLAAQLNRLYDQRGRAFRIEEVAGGMQLLTRPVFSKWLRRSSGTSGEFRISAPAVETLAVVAYRQPVLRADIEVVRGVSCGEILRQLIEQDLVRISGRSGELGRPYLYSTTKRFLQLFGLRTLDELPRKADWQAGLPNASHEEKAGVNPPDVCQDEEDSEVSIAELSQRKPEQDESPVVGKTHRVDAATADDEFEEDFDSDDLEDEYEDDEDDDDEDDDDEFEDGEWEEVEDDEDDDDDSDEDWEDDEEWEDDDEEDSDKKNSDKEDSDKDKPK